MTLTPEQRADLQKYVEFYDRPEFATDRWPGSIVGAIKAALAADAPRTMLTVETTATAAQRLMEITAVLQAFALRRETVEEGSDIVIRVLREVIVERLHAAGFEGEPTLDEIDGRLQMGLAMCAVVATATRKGES